MDLSIRRAEVYRLLKQGSCEKLLFDRTRDALERVNEAYELTFDKEGLPLLLEPFPSLVCYRKALLMLRGEELTHDKLLEIDELLSRARKENSLGPWPRLYRLSVLGRLRELGQVPEPKIKKAYAAARSAVKDYLNEERWDEYTQTTNVIQREIFNALELSTFFLGRKYSDLEGVGARFFADSGSSSEIFLGMGPEDERWYLLSSKAELRSVIFPRSLALRELETVIDRCRANNEEGLFFIFDGETAKWKSSCMESWIDVEREWVYVLAYCVSEISRSSHNSVRARLAETLNKRDGTLRTMLHRIKGRISEQTGVRAFAETSDFLAAVQTINTVGAVNHTAYEGFEP